MNRLLTSLTGSIIHWWHHLRDQSLTGDITYRINRLLITSLTGSIVCWLHHLQDQSFDDYITYRINRLLITSLTGSIFYWRHHLQDQSMKGDITWQIKMLQTTLLTYVWLSGVKGLSLCFDWLHVGISQSADRGMNNICLLPYELKAHW